MEKVFAWPLKAKQASRSGADELPISISITVSDTLARYGLLFFRPYFEGAIIVTCICG